MPAATPSKSASSRPDRQRGHVRPVVAQRHGSWPIEELNAAGGVLGKKFELITEDDQSQAGQPATVVRKLISRDGVVAILGEVASSRSLEAAPICQQNQIPMISPSSTNPKVTEVGDYIFRVCFIDSFQGGQVMANFAQQHSQSKICGGVEGCEKRLQPRPGEIFQGRIYCQWRENCGRSKITTAATRISTRNSPPSRPRIPTRIFVPGYYTEVGLIALQAKQLGINVPCSAATAGNLQR